MNCEDEIISMMKKSGIDYALTLPCDKVKNLISIVPRHFRHIPLTREEDGVGISAGLALAGKKPVMILQNSGVGNMVNALCSLTKIYGLPLPLLVSLRGVHNEKIPAQVPMGKYLPKLLESIEVQYEIVDDADKLNIVGKAISGSFDKNIIYLALISPKVWEKSDFKNVGVEMPREGRAAVEPDTLPATTGRPFSRNPSMTRFEIIKSAVPWLTDKAVVSNIGIPSKELYRLCDRESNFYMLGSFGLASSIGLGVSLGTEKEVVVIDGDGSILYNPNALCSIAQERPPNLTILCIDNGVHGSTGSQPTASSSFVDLEMVARSFGINNTVKARTESEIKSAFEGSGKGPKFIHAIAKPGNENFPEIPLTPIEIRNRFMEFLRKR